MRSPLLALAAVAILALACASPEKSVEKIWVRVNKVQIEGVDAEPELSKQLLETTVRVSPITDGIVEPRPGLGVVQIAIGKIPGDGDRGRMVNEVVMQRTINALTRTLAATDHVGARIAFRREDLDALKQGSGVLVLRVDLPEPLTDPAEDAGGTESADEPPSADAPSAAASKPTEPADEKASTKPASQESTAEAQAAGAGTASKD